MPTERFTFPGHNGDQLAARLDLPEGPVLATALFAHCFTCGKDIAAARRISARLSGAGIAVLRFDFTGLGHSDGEFENTSFTSNVDDLVAAAQALGARGMPPGLLIGHSLGGAAVLRAAGQLDNVKAVATIGAPFEPEHVTHQFQGHLDEILIKGAGEVQLGPRKLRVGRGFVQDITGQRLEDSIRNLGAALLVMHAPRDATVAIDNATQIFMAAKHPKSFVTLDNADHLVSRLEDAEYAADVIGAWASRYLDLRRPAPPIGAPEGVTRVSESGGGYTQDITAACGKHHILADEPIAYGGADMGMTPYQLLAASLGSCTSITLRMYANRKDWPLEKITVDVTHDKMHAQDAPIGSEKIDHFYRSIMLRGPLTPDQKDRLLEIADKCPVHRTLEKGAVVKTELVSDTLAQAAE